MDGSIRVVGVRGIVQRGADRLLLPVGLHWGLFLAYLAVLPVAGPIALRNVILALLTIQSLAVCIGKAAFHASGVLRAVAAIPLWLVLWGVFLFLFPLMAQHPGVAWREFGGQWGESLLAWLAAFVVVIRRGKPGSADLWAVAAASAFYPVLYLVLFFCAWAGLFGHPPYIEDISRNDFLALVARNAGHLHWPDWATLPWGFRGFDPIHANLGATAVHAFVAAVALGVAGWKNQAPRRRAGLLFFAGVMFLIPFLANSRATVICLGAVFLLGLVLIAWLSGREDRTRNRLKNSAVLAVGVLLALTAAVAYQSYERDQRWRGLYEKAVIGFVIPDAMEVVCNGVGPKTRAIIQKRLAGLPAERVDEIVQAMSGDGGRALVMRASMELVLEQPIGWDGSRAAYKQLIHERCGKAPAINFVHPHQGWIDIALALGWSGALLYFGMFAYLMRLAWAGLRDRQAAGWAWGLLLLCVFWLARGFFDSMYREHYLQMQAALMGFFWAGLLVRTGKIGPNINSNNA